MKNKKILALTMGFLTSMSSLNFVACSNNNIPSFDVKDQVIDEFAGDNLVNSEIEGISSIYRESQKNYEIVDYLKERVTNILGKQPTFYDDDAHNMWFDIPASAGCENYKTIIIQGHTDMVVEVVDEAAEADIKANGVWVVIDDDGIAHSKDNRTSLGSDNGIGLAMALIMLKERNNFKHGPIRFLFSADEEPGMLGAKYAFDNEEDIFIDQNGQSIDYLINVDAEAKFSIYRSCAGGFNFCYTNTFSNNNEEMFDNCYDIYIDGFAGGHSGNDIELMKFNADRAIFEILDSLCNSESPNQLQILNFDHKLYGQDDDIKWSSNQLIKNAHVTIALDKKIENLQEYIINYANENWKTKYTGENWENVNFHATFVKNNLQQNFISSEDSSKICSFIGHSKDPNEISKGYYYGVYDWIGEGKSRRPKASTNIGPVSIKENNNAIDLEFWSYSRETDEQWMNGHIANYKTIWFKYFPSNSNVDEVTQFLPWNAKNDSQLLNLAFDAYENQGVEPYFRDTRGGVEPAFWSHMNTNLDCICIGPYIANAHTVNEILDTSTINIAYNAIIDIIQKLK